MGMTVGFCQSAATLRFADLQEDLLGLMREARTPEMMQVANQGRATGPPLESGIRRQEHQHHQGLHSHGAARRNLPKFWRMPGKSDIQDKSWTPPSPWLNSSRAVSGRTLRVDVREVKHAVEVGFQELFVFPEDLGRQEKHSSRCSVECSDCKASRWSTTWKRL